MELKLKEIINKRIVNNNFETLNNILRGTGYYIKNDNQIYDVNNIARGSFSLKFIDDNEVEIRKFVPYGIKDELALICQ